MCVSMCVWCVCVCVVDCVCVCVCGACVCKAVNFETILQGSPLNAYTMNPPGEPKESDPLQESFVAFLSDVSTETEL